MISKLLQNQCSGIFILYCLCIGLVYSYGCKKVNPEKTIEDVPVNKMVKISLKITNTGVIDIKRLNINYNYDANSCNIGDLKIGQVVHKEIVVSYPTTLEYIIEYANGEIIKYPPKEGFMAPGEFQIVIEENGKMYFR